MVSRTLRSWSLWRLGTSRIPSFLASLAVDYTKQSKPLNHCYTHHRNCPTRAGTHCAAVHTCRSSLLSRIIAAYLYIQAHGGQAMPVAQDGIVRANHVRERTVEFGALRLARTNSKSVAAAIAEAVPMIRGLLQLAMV
jgi:hypothetical protein